MVHYEQESMVCTFVLRDNDFEYIDKEKSFKLIWSLFKPMTTYKDNILLNLKDGGLIFTVKRNEVGDEEYYDLCNILKDKIG